MSTEDKRTKADLLAELATARQETQDARSAAYKAQQALPGAPTAVPEATALAACIRAIDTMNEGRRTSSNVGYSSTLYAYGNGYNEPHQQDEVERLLRSLAAKYGVPLIETRTDPCARRHLDEINPDRIMQALHS